MANHCVSMDKINLSFSGCGFLGIYHVGVASCFREYCPQITIAKVSGASAGALVATAMACDLPLDESTTSILRVAMQARSRALGPFHPTFDIVNVVRDALDKALPEDAHKRVNGKLHISVTRVSDGKNVILSHFNCKQDLMQALLCSCFIPFYSGIVPPKFHGVAYMDGGFSDNLPVLDDNTITVSPFAGETDICPEDSSSNILQVNVANTSIAVSPGNIYRITRILFPPHPEVMSKMCQQGFDDALRYLQKNNLISCLRCVNSRTSISCTKEELLQQALAMSGDVNLIDNCIDCLSRREQAIMDSLPAPVAKAIQEACDQVNKGVINWIFKHKPVRVISLLAVPYVLPFDIAIVVLKKLWNLLPLVKKELQQSLINLIEFTTNLVRRLEDKCESLSTDGAGAGTGTGTGSRVTCRFAINQADYSTERHPNRLILDPNRHVSKRQDRSQCEDFYVDGNNPTHLILSVKNSEFLAVNIDVNSLEASLVDGQLEN